MTDFQEASREVLEKIAASILGPAKPNSGGIVVKCPAHDDKSPSLAVSIKNGRLLVHCLAGCSQAATIEALRAQGLWFNGSGCECRPPAVQRQPSGGTKFDAQLWGAAAPASSGCRYLLTKCVKAHGLRYHSNSLLVPAMDIGGNVYGVQRIWPDGSKRFAPGSDKVGHFFQIGTPQHDTILIAEGYATAATLHEVTGHAAVVAFDCGNLLPVAAVLLAAYPKHRLVICSDDDYTKPGNPGLTRATEATKAVDGLLAIPVFTGTRGPKDTDFNDLRRLEGPETVIGCVSAARRIL